MSDTIEFYKNYARRSKSPWDDTARVAMLWQPETKLGVYLHLGAFGINGVSLSKRFQERMPSGLQSQYLIFEHLDIVMHVFAHEIEEYCTEKVSNKEFKEVFLLNQDSFFNETSKAYWQFAYNNYCKTT
ncbi:hypothetical protein [Thalassotalea sp. ND16A]|uniref:hypothetical protein n=1 Tax=Thalassotalea sp. ND16A TaxID=1535422 RepID=UPI00051A7820|nr:hypothetical protein [Thalassotalea sp. ND16A]KGJ99884.1 hypothetical protein ND16A_3672 [Thalassotalea sp. ND16A]